MYLFIAHDLEMVHHISHKIGVMYLGNMVELGSSDVVYNETIAIRIRSTYFRKHRLLIQDGQEKNRIILEARCQVPIKPPNWMSPFAEDESTQPRNVSPKNRTLISMITGQVALQLISPKNLAEYKAVGKTVEPN